MTTKVRAEHGFSHKHISDLQSVTCHVRCVICQLTQVNVLHLNRSQTRWR